MLSTFIHVFQLRCGTLTPEVHQLNHIYKQRIRKERHLRKRQHTKVESSESQILKCVGKQRNSTFFRFRLSGKVSPELSRQHSGTTLKLQEKTHINTCIYILELWAYIQEWADMRGQHDANRTELPFANRKTHPVDDFRDSRVTDCNGQPKSSRRTHARRSRD